MVPCAPQWAKPLRSRYRYELLYPLLEDCCAAVRLPTAPQPVESQDVLGRVRSVVRDRNGQIMVVIDFGGFFGFGTRPIAVPVDAMVLLGQDMEIVAFTPKQLQQFSTFSPSGTTDVPNDTIIKIGLAKPSH